MDLFSLQQILGVKNHVECILKKKELSKKFQQVSK